MQSYAYLELKVPQALPPLHGESWDEVSGPGAGLVAAGLPARPRSPRRSRGWIGAGAGPAARALCRGAPCPTAAELHRRRHRGAAGPARGRGLQGRGLQGQPWGGGAGDAGRSRPAAGW